MQVLEEGKSELWKHALWVNDSTPSEERPPDLVRFCAPLDAEDLVQVFFDVDLVDEVFCVPARESGKGGSSRCSGRQTNMRRLCQSDREALVCV